MGIRTCAFATLLFALIGVHTRAHAQSAQADEAAAFELDWEAPSDCMNAEQAHAAIARLLAGSSTQERAEVEVAIEPSDDGQFTAEIRVQRGDHEGERAIEGESCARVAEAATWIVAMAIDPTGMAQRSEPEPEAPAAEATPERVRISLAVRASGDTGALPTSTWGGGLALGVRYARLYAELEALAWLPQDSRSGPVPGSGASVGLYTGALRGCFELGRVLESELAVSGCLAAEAGLTTGSALGISNGRSQRGLWSAGLLGLHARQALTEPLSLEWRVDVGAPLHRPTFEIDGFGPVFRASSLIGRASLALRWVFP